MLHHISLGATDIERAARFYDSALEALGYESVKVRVTIQPQGARPMSFAPEVLACEPEREFRWRGKVLVGGVFDGEHALRLVESAAGSCRFVHEETFSGVLVPLLMRGALRTRTEAGFNAMNRALKLRAERGDGHPR